MPVEDVTRPLHGVERVLAVRLDNLGDVLLLGPALRALRQALPDAHLDLLASPAGALAGPLLPWVDDVLVEEVVWQDAAGRLPLDPGREQALVARLAARRYDAALIFTSWSQSPWPPAYACYVAGIPVRAGESKEFGGGLLTHRAACLPDDVHQADRNLHLVAALAIDPGSSRLEVAVPATDVAPTEDLLASVGVRPPFVVVAPGASCQARRYPPERGADVVRALLARGLPVVVVGSARERELLAPVIAVPGAIDLVGITTVGQLAALLARAAVAVTNDSGPMHLAAAVGTPLVVLYAGTELVSQWAPQHVPAVLLRVPTPCTPCYRFDCPYDQPCLAVDPEDVVAAAVAMAAAAARTPA